MRIGSMIALTVGIGWAALACSLESTEAPFLESITEADLRADLFALSHDSMGGRLVGTPDIERASDWIRDRFSTLGLEPAGDDGTYDQRFDLVWFSLGDGPSSLTMDGASGPREPGQGWTPSNVSGTGTASGPVAFVGHGIVEPRLGYDDYQGADVGGKIVLMLEGEPGVDDPASPFDGVVTTEGSRTWRKALWAQERGAAGVLFVRDVSVRAPVGDWEANHRGSWPAERRRVERFTLGAWVDRIEIPAAHVAADLADALVRISGNSLSEHAVMASDSSSGYGVIELPGTTVDLSVSVQRNVVQGRNVLAMAEGADPDLRNEVVIIGAHHDHNGVDGETVFNGADDDGSGTVGVMAVAEAYARAVEAGEGPRRSVIFAIWDAEERGLLGAWYYTVSPLFPLENTVAKLNLDMIGRNQEVPSDGGGRFRGLEEQTSESNANATNILGYSRAPELADAVAAANEATGLILRFRYDNNESNLLRRSDHWPFLQNDVPAVWFHTGLHPDYHTPDDDPERIEYEKMTRIVQLVYQTSWDIANANGRPGIEPMGPRPRS